jgi:hypothetical protein
MMLLLSGRSCLVLAAPCSLLLFYHCAQRAHSCLVQAGESTTALRCPGNRREVPELSATAAQKEVRAQAAA